MDGHGYLGIHIRSYYQYLFQYLFQLINIVCLRSSRWMNIIGEKPAPLPRANFFADSYMLHVTCIWLPLTLT